MADSPATTDALEQYDAQQHDEWNTYVAAVAIDIDNARAFNVGDAVPASHISRGIITPDMVTHVKDLQKAEQAVPRATVAALPGTAPPDPKDAAAAEKANVKSGAITPGGE